MIGISTDTLADQQKFTTKESLNYPLMSDEGAKVSRTLGVMLNDKLAKRITFVIDKQGKIAKIYEKVSPAGHPEEVLKFVKEHLSK